MKERIRLLTADECRDMLDWAAAEGWNPGRHDAEAFQAADPGGFWGLFEGESLAATISAVRYPPDFAFLGFYICRPERRGRGLGRRLWRHALDAIDAQCVGLDGVVAQQDNYRKSGFVLAHRNVRYGGTAATIPDGDRRLRLLGPADVREMARFERANRLFPADRERFVRTWLRTPRHVAMGIGPAGSLAGYGVIRPCRIGWKIGPLFAAGPDDAALLAGCLASRARGAPVFLDIPEPNGGARRLAERLGLRPVFETARMYRGPAPDLALGRTFGITSFELG